MSKTAPLRSEAVRIRLSVDEQQAVRAEALRAGLGVSELLRLALMREMAARKVEMPLAAKAQERLAEVRQYADAVTPEALEARWVEFNRTEKAVQRRVRDHLAKHPDAPQKLDLEWSRRRPPVPKRPRGMSVLLNLGPREVIELERHAAMIHVKPARFCSLLVRQWLGLHIANAPDTTTEIKRLCTEIRRIGVNINQLALIAHTMLELPVHPNRRLFLEMRDLKQGIRELPMMVKRIEELGGAVVQLINKQFRFMEIVTTPGNPVMPHPDIPVIYENE